ncbi:hypothetical protein BHE74_00037487 [Ensete ventricosum]|nr:hypothetical protein BHE74_00037487 [Ensete ventricosum]
MCIYLLFPIGVQERSSSPISASGWRSSTVLKAEFGRGKRGGLRSKICPYMTPPERRGRNRPELVCEHRQSAYRFRTPSKEEMAKSCKGLAMELVKCLSESDCVKVCVIRTQSYRVSSWI